MQAVDFDLVDLGECACQNASRVGGQAASLGRLAAHHLVI